MQTGEGIIVQLEQNPQSASGRVPRHETLIDTTDHPNEAILFGDDIKLIRETVNGGDWFVLTGPDGEISLPARYWKRIAGMMRVGGVS